jgi:hypothetical protein
LKGLWADGDTPEDCRQNLIETLEDWIFVSLKEGLPIPAIDGVAPRAQPSFGNGGCLIRISRRELISRMSYSGFADPLPEASCDFNQRRASRSDPKSASGRHDISLLKRILREAEITLDDWESTE